MVRRARKDGARGVFSVPRNRKLAYYQSLRQNAMFKQDLDAAPDPFEYEVHRRQPGREKRPVGAEEARALVQQISLLEEEVRRL